MHHAGEGLDRNGHAPRTRLLRKLRQMRPQVRQNVNVLHLQIVVRPQRDITEWAQLKLRLVARADANRRRAQWLCAQKQTQQPAAALVARRVLEKGTQPREHVVKVVHE